MKVGTWIIEVGMACGFVLAVIAMLPDVFGRSDVADVAAAIAENPGSGAASVDPVLGRRNAVPDGGNLWDRTPSSLGRYVALKGLAPFAKARSQRFQGRIESSIVRGAEIGWGQVHIWVTDGIGPPQRISLAPDWYLDYVGCPIAENLHVKGAAFDFDTIRSGDKLYARTITVRGRTCHLRNDEGFALWSNQLR